ncbi:hypothetical protein QSV37_16445 [Acinetobacter sp. VNK23]|uniref:hypothetical protein n=1 Tax=Acinetobacter thutiue TaxID=2998078 RepID=UPI002575215E|nr:hypothetical protein [Acinetobacter thutiue]MDM1021869.1 hypothetical protein [Acinetobacter thutiue]
MGTSTSSKGPGSKSPLVPSWADNDGQGPGNNQLEQRFRGFRAALGQAASTGGGNTDTLKKALGHYAKSATGGKSNGARRFSSMISGGGTLFDTLRSLQSGTDTNSLNISDLQGQPVDVVIDKIIESIIDVNGDSERIRAAMNEALAEALDGLSTFDFSKITDDIIVDMMINYLTQCIFEQIILDSKTAFDKADTPEKVEMVESSLLELIKTSVDLNFGSHLENISTLTKQDIETIQKNAIQDIWGEWEDHLND